MVLLFIIKAIVLFITQYLSVRIKADYERNTRENLLKSTFAADWPYLSEQKIGHLDQNEIARIQLEYVKYVMD